MMRPERGVIVLPQPEVDLRDDHTHGLSSTLLTTSERTCDALFRQQLATVLDDRHTLRDDNRGLGDDVNALLGLTASHRRPFPDHTGRDWAVQLASHDTAVEAMSFT